MIFGHDARIRRASELAGRYPASTELLGFYSELALFQKQVYGDLQAGGVTDVLALARYFPGVIELVERAGTEPLVNFAAGCLASASARQELLVASWQREPSSELAVDPAGRFFARVLLQPYAEYLASRAQVSLEGAAATCPFCNSRPVAGVLRGEGEGGKRWLLCSLCSTEWPFRRVLCPNCAEENKDQLPIFTAAQIEAVRVDACDACRTYIKSVDLTKDGHAVPIVDEIATVALDIWADEHGYSKLEANLLGM
jgi:FdhE protein